MANAVYPGDTNGFDRAIVGFSERCGEQTVDDYQRFPTAIADGTLPVSPGL